MRIPVVNKQWKQLEGDLMSRLQQQRKGSKRTRKFAFGIGAALCAALLAVSVAVAAQGGATASSDSSVSNGSGASSANAASNDTQSTAETNATTPSYVVQSATPANTTTNFFDYWTTDKQNDYVENGWKALTGTSGINAGHVLQFNIGKGTGINAWTGSADVNKFVKSTLENNFPVIKSGVSSDSGTVSEDESLDYLFNSYDYQSINSDGSTSENAVAGKKAYTNVSGLFQLDDKGYYTYDSTKNFALFNPDSTGNSGSFTVYSKSAVGTGNFFPLTANQALTDVFDVSGDTITAKSGVTADSNNTVNHHMGVSMDTTFTQPVDGKVASGDAMTYEFSGDDDVWVYIDGVLVGDLGGIHSKASLSIDFSTGNITVNSGTKYETTTTLKAAYDAAGKTSSTSWNNNTFASNTIHDLKFFYLERGAGASNMYLKFNLQTSPVSEVDKVDQNGNDVKGAQFALYSTDENYSTTGRTLLATGTTDEDGILQLKDAEGTAISFDIQYAEYKRQYFALVETSIPEGYRTSLSSNDHEMRLKYEPTESALGFSAGGVLVTASDSSGTNRMWLNGGYAAAMETLIAPSTVHTYEDSETTYNTGDGVTFAVICKRINNGDIADITSWAPVTGDAYNGYTVASELNVATAVSAAKESGAIYTKSSAGEYVATLSNMPGDIKTYAAMMKDPDNSQFTVITAHTTASSLDEATDDNTWIMDSSKFTREFATSLKVTNIQNRLWVTKVNSAGEAQNGAKFSLYKAADVENDIVTNEDGTLSLKEGSTAVAYDTATTADITDPYTMSGAACFPADSDGHKALTNGVYYLVETAAPSGYELNSNVTKVYVTDGGVYADAGIEGDGVKTMSGPGSLLASLAQFGSNGTVDNTLYKITGTIQKASANGSVLTWAAPATGAQSMNMHYTDKDGSSSVVLQYVNDDGNKLAALYEDTGISRMQITQNSTFAASGDFHGTNLGSQAINSLFTQSTGVQYTDKLLPGNLNIEMKNSGGNADDEFEVTVELKDAKGDPISGTFGDVVFDEDGKATITLKGGESKSIPNVPSGATYTVKQTSKDGYQTSYTVNDGSSSTAPATGTIAPNGTQNVSVKNEFSAKIATVQRDGKTVYVNDQLVAAGEEITYTIGWANTTNNAGVNVTVTDELPKGLEFVSAYNGGTYDKDKNTVTWVFENQAGDAAGTVTLKAKVSESDFGGNSITNSATVKLEDVLGYTTWYNPKSSTVNVLRKQVLHKSIYDDTDKDINGEAISINDILHYEITFTVSEDVDSAVLTDKLPEGTRIKGNSSGGYNSTTNTQTWKFEKLEAGKQYTAWLEVAVNADSVATIDDYINQAQLELNGSGTKLNTNKVSNTVAKGDLDVKLVTDPANTGDTFKVTVKANENNNYAIIGTFGEGANAITFDENGEATFEMKGGDTKTLTDLPAGATYTVTQTDKDGYSTTYTVNAGDSSPTPATGKIDSTAKQTVVITNKLGKTATVQRDGQQVDAGGQLIGVGDVITYNINWLNDAKDADGKLTSAAVTVTDALPAGTELVEGSLGTGSYDSETGTITWSLGEQAAGASGTVSFQAKVTDAAVTGSVENAASIKIGDNDPVSTNTVKSQMPKKTVARQAAGSETVGDAVATGSQAAVGDTLVYNVSFTVPSDCDSVIVTDAVPVGTAYVADSADNDGSFDQAKGVVTWKFGKLKAGTTVNVSFKAKVLASALTEAGNVVSNTAQVQIGANGPKVSSNNVPTEIAKSVTVKGGTDLKFTKSLAGRDWASTDKFTFTIAADIEGAPMPANATAVVTSSTAKANDAVEFDFGDIQFTAPGTYRYTVTEIGNTASDVLSDLVPAKVTVVVADGGKGVLEAKVTVENGDFTNEAVVKTATFANTAADADDDEATDVKVGDVLRYAITWANTTGEAATVVVTDKLPEGLTLDETKLEDAVYDAATRTITWTINADKTESGQVAFYAAVNSAAVQSASAGSATISNSAAVTVSAKDNPNVTTAATSKPFDSKVSTGDVEVSLKNDGGDPTQKFDVTITVTDKGGNPVAGTFGEGDNAITFDKDGKATIAMVGGDTQKLTGLPEGATVTVTQTGDDGYTTTYTVNGTPADPAKATVDPTAPQKVVITNTAIKKVDYSANGGVVVSKTVNGHAMTAGQFAYTVKPDAAAAKKLGLDSSANAYKVTAADDGMASVIDLFGGKNVVFGPEDAGTYTFSIDETTAPNGSGYTNDSAQRTVTITVSVDPTTREVTVVTTATKAGEDKPFATSTVKSDDKAGTVNKVVVPFVSAYEATGTLGGDGDGAVAIQASKTLNGRDMAAGEFNFVVTDAKGTQVAAGTNAAATSGTAAAVTFSKIDYSVASLKEAVAAGAATMTADGAYKLQYNVAESTELPAGVTAGAKSFAITVTVTDNGDGTLTPKVTYPEGTESLAFTNSYSSESAPVAFAGTKVLSMSDASLTRELKAGEFSFTVTATDGGKLPESTTATNDAAGNVKFGTVAYTQDDLAGVTADKDGIRTKTFTYQVSESGSVDGVTNDASAHKFTVTLTEDTAKATLTATVKAEEGTAATAGAFSFTNVYGVSDSSSSITDDTVEGQQPIKVKKTLTGRAMTAGEFKFELVDGDGTTVATGTNQADGTVTFGAVKYSKPGTYTYELREAEGELGGVTYDSTTYTVVTTVTDLGTGKLKVEHALYSAAGKEIADGVAKFANSYEPAATVAKINASKVLTGATLAKDQFTFAVTDADGNVVGTVTNDENGKISFSGLIFTADDMVDESGARVMTKTFTYYLTEVNDVQANVTYDGTVYTITVTVTDDGEGNLTAVVAYENVDDAPVFNNTYTEPAKAQAAASNNKTSSAKTGDGALQTILMLIGVAMAAAAGTAAVSVRRKRNSMSE
jgi:pilin isopeptide linkage protein/fibro-slime domain-containing protein/uncharacterized repeat protein (TIGR01451 family)